MTFERAFFLIALLLITLVMGVAVVALADNPQPVVVTLANDSQTVPTSNQLPIFQTATALALNDVSSQLNPIFRTATAVAFSQLPSGASNATNPNAQPTALADAGGGGGGFLPQDEVTLLSAEERLLIKTVVMDLTIQNVVTTNEQIQALVEDSGGWVVTSTLDRPKDRRSDYVTSYLVLRVPSEQLDSTVQQIKGLALTVNSESVQGQDVTDDYNDQQSQLRNLEAAEAQLLELLETTINNDDVLATFNQLTSIRNQIEQIKGQVQYYEQSALYSTIELRLSPPYISPTPTATFTPSPTPTATPEAGWKPDETFNNATDSAVNTVQTAIDGLIWVVVYGLLLALFVVPLWALYRWRRG